MKTRLRFTKQGKVRFLSHRDLARIWERTLRRAGVAVAYSEGFSPRPRLHFGLALSTGYESLGEYLDIDLLPDSAPEPDALVELVNPHLPIGLVAQAAIVIPQGTESLQQAVTSCSWRLEVIGADRDALADAVTTALAATALPTTVERKGTPVELDARPVILELAAGDLDAHPPGVAPLRPSALLLTELATQPRSLRPAELVGALDPSWTVGAALRTHQWTLVDGARCEPIALGDGGSRSATSTSHASVRAS